MNQSNPFQLKVTVGEPYVNATGALVILIDICGEKIEREIEGFKDDKGRYILKQPDNET